MPSSGCCARCWLLAPPRCQHSNSRSRVHSLLPLITSSQFCVTNCHYGVLQGRPLGLCHPQGRCSERSARKAAVCCSGLAGRNQVSFPRSFRESHKRARTLIADRQVPWSRNQLPRPCSCRHDYLAVVDADRDSATYSQVRPRRRSGWRCAAGAACAGKTRAATTSCERPGQRSPPMLLFKLQALIPRLRASCPHCPPVCHR